MPYKSRIQKFDSMPDTMDDDEFMDDCETICFDCAVDFNNLNFGINIGRGVSLCKSCLDTEKSEVLPFIFHQCCQNIMDSQFADGYAKAYAQTGLDMTSLMFIDAQILYIQSNISKWKDEKAHNTRIRLKEVSACLK